MNQVILIGRLTNDFSVKNNIARSTIAVAKDYGDGTDYIDITAFGKTADYCSKYSRKGDLISVVGSWNTYKDKEKKTHHSCTIKEFKLLVKSKDEEVGESYIDNDLFEDDEDDDDIDEQNLDLPF